MLEQIQALPAGIWGVRAVGKVSKDDYEHVVLPTLNEARREGRRVRFLYHFPPEFDRFTAGAAWEDLRVGVQYLRLFERCAVVTDIDWIRNTTRAMGALMPCPVRVFAGASWQEAVSWLSSPPQTSLTYRMLPDRGVLLIEPHARLSAEDFDALSAAADAWIESADGSLDGIVVHAREFPGWENFGTFLRHVRFVRDHHRKIRRVAVASDSKLAGIAGGLVETFVQADIRRFEYGEVDWAVEWASGRQPAGTQGHAPDPHVAARE